MQISNVPNGEKVPIDSTRARNLSVKLKQRLKTGIRAPLCRILSLLVSMALLSAICWYNVAVLCRRGRKPSLVNRFDENTCLIISIVNEQSAASEQAAHLHDTRTQISPAISPTPFGRVIQKDKLAILKKK